MKESLIFTGYACNENCFFCSAEVGGRKEVNKSTKEILNNILSEYKAGSKSIEFIGGEVLIRKDIFIILAFSKKLGFTKISIETNGVKLEDYQFGKKLLQNGLNYITMSIHGSNPKINDSHTLLKGSFIYKKKALDNLSKLSNEFNFHLSTNFVITSLNTHDILNFLKFINRYKYISKIIFAFVRPLKSYRKKYNYYLPSFIKIKTIFESIKINNKVLIQYLPYCILAEKFHTPYLNFFSKGLKNNITKINIKDEISLEEAIQSEEYYFKECTTCKYKLKCRGVWKEYIHYFVMKKPPLLIDIK